MPLLEITTNIVVESAQDIASKASKLAAEMLGKPESYVMVKLQSEQVLLFAGTDEAAAHIKLKSLGLAEDRTKELSTILCHFAETELGIKSARIYIEFANPARHMWGWDNTTF